MIKRILITSLSLFMPIFVNGETLVIGSKNSLTEKNLPFVYEIMEEVYTENLYNRECYTKDNHSLYEPFLEGDVSIPFSGKDLLKICRKSIISYYKDRSIDYVTGFVDLTGTQICKEKLCVHFVLNYVKEISQVDYMVDASKRDIAYNFDSLKLAEHKFVDDFDNCAKKNGGVAAYISERVIEQGIESVSSKELLKYCKDFYSQWSWTWSCKDHCSEFVEMYKSALK